MNINAINNVSHKGLGNLAKFAVVATTLATTPVQATAVKDIIQDRK